MTVVRLATTAALIGLLMVGVLAVPARAHGGELVYSGRVGPYYLEITDRVLETGEGLLYTLILRNGATGLPVDGADVSVTAQVGDRSVGPRRAQYFGNQYQVLIRDDGADTVEVSVTIEAPPGTTSFRHEIAGSGAGRSWLPALVLAAGGMVVIGSELRRRHVHRRETGSRSPQDGGRTGTEAP